MSDSIVPIGIDIGTKGIHVATTPSRKPTFIPFEGDWTAALARLVPPGALCALEPTGWHYSAPVIQALLHIGAQALIVENRATGKFRQEITSISKTDDADARTLCAIATLKLQGWDIRSAHVADMQRINDLRALRLLIYAHMRATKELVRTTNRLHQIAFSIAPEVDQRFETWLRCVEAGAVCADAIIALSRRADRTTPGFKHGNARNGLKALAASLPPWADGQEMHEVAVTELAVLRIVEPRVERTEQRLIDLMEGPTFGDLTRLWRTVPSSSDMEIARIIAACNGNPTAYDSNGFLAAIGGQPKQVQSGKKKKETMNTAGFRPARVAATMWANRLIALGNNPIAEAAMRAEGRNVKKRPRVRAKLINILWGIARSGQPYDPNHAAKDGVR